MKMENSNEKIRALFGIFPVWLKLLDDGGCEVTGFWSDIAIFVDQSMDFLCHTLSFGEWDREVFAFFPYKSNGCKYWFQAALKMINEGRHD
jgi:hypothetical protein